MAAGAEGLRTIGVAPDSAVFAFTAAALLITSILVGLLPALRVAAFDPNTALRETRAERSAARAARILIPTQVALTAVLAVAAALLLSTFGNFHRVDLGYPPAELLTFRANPGSAGYDADRSRVYFTDLLSRLEGLPSVRSVALSSDSIANLGNTTGVTLPGLADYEESRVGYYRVGPRWAETTGLRLLRGREFNAADAASGARIAVVNQNFARKYFGTLDCIGREFGLMSVIETPPYTIVGVVESVRDRGPKQPAERVLYTQIAAQPLQTAIVTLRVAGHAAPLLPTVSSFLKEADPAVVITQMQTVEDLVSEQLGRERLLATLSACFGLLALVLVAVGLYGMIAGSVAARTRELGIRISLGAKPTSVVWLVTRESVALVLTGATTGLIAGALLTRLIESQLFGVSPADVWAYLAAAAALIAATALAAYLPARSATRVDPASALRCE
jgi:predicted permease